MPTFLTVILPDDKVGEVIAAMPAEAVHTCTTLPAKKFAINPSDWAMRHGVPAAAALLAQWQRITMMRKDVH